MNDDTYPLAGRRVHRVGYRARQLPGPGVFGPPRLFDSCAAGAVPTSSLSHAREDLAATAVQLDDEALADLG